MEVEELKQQVEYLEAMLKHASDTIGRLEGRWRAPEVDPGSNSEGQVKVLAVVQGDPVPRVAVKYKGLWFDREGTQLNVLAWHELPPLPAADAYGDLK